MYRSEQDAEIINRLLRLEVELIDERLRRVEQSLLFRLLRSGSSWLKNMATMMGRRRSDTGELSKYGAWLQQDWQRLPSAEEAVAAIASWRSKPFISVIFLTDATNNIEAAMPAMGKQFYTRYEVLPVSEAPGESYASRINMCSRGARGDYLLFLRACDQLRPHALYYLAESVRDGDFDVVYADHDVAGTGSPGRIPVFKPSWSPALLRHLNYWGFPLLVSKAKFLEAGGIDPAEKRAGWHELALRLGKLASIGHIPRVLVHSGIPATDGRPRQNASHSLCQDTQVVICSRSPDLLSACLSSLRQTAGPSLATITVVGHAQGTLLERLAQVAQRYGAVLEPYSGPFNFARMCNAGAERSSTPHVLFINDDVVSETPGWLEAMTEELAQDKVGVVGAVLRYPSGSLQHAGIVLGMADGAGHVGRGFHSSKLWPWLFETRDVSAVTGACMLVHRDVFRQLGGFDPLFPNNYNDVDFCLRARAAGFSTVVCAVDGVVHMECQTRKGIVRTSERLEFLSRWRRILERPDPFYSPCLAPEESIQFRLMEETLWPLAMCGSDAGETLWRAR